MRADEWAGWIAALGAIVLVVVAAAALGAWLVEIAERIAGAAL